MELVVVRHAIARERDLVRWPGDRGRPLTRKGTRRFRKSAAGLKWLSGEVDRVLTSPLRRARQTAKLLETVAGWPAPIDCPALQPACSATEVVRLLRRFASGRIAVVGHEPDLSRLIAVLVGDSGSRPSLVLKKGGAALVRFERSVRPGAGRLCWLLQPQQLRALRR